MTKQVRIYLFLFLATLLAGLPAYGKVGSGIIKMTTAKNVGKQIDLNIIADGDFTIEGVDEQPQQGYNSYTITNQQIVIRGNVTELYCGGNQLTVLDLSHNTALTQLNCGGNHLTELDLSHNTALTALWCGGNQLTELDLSKKNALTDLNCGGNHLTELNVSKNTVLTRLYCGGNQLTVLDLSHNTALTQLGCDNNQLTVLDLSHNTALTELWCGGNQLTELDLSKKNALTDLNCGGNHLTELNVSKNTVLTRLYCGGNQLTELDLSHNTALAALWCGGNQLTELDLSHNTALTALQCQDNQLTALDVSQNTALTKLECFGNKIKDDEMTRLVNSLPDRSGEEEGTFVVVQTERPQSNKCLKSDVAIAWAKNWRTKQRIDSSTDKDYLGAGNNSVITLITARNVGETIGLDIIADGAFTIEGVEEQPQQDYNYYTITNQQIVICGDVTKLDCRDNQLTTLDLSHNTALTQLGCDNNQLTALDLSHNTALTQLGCDNNQLTALVLSQNTALTQLNCGDNQLTELDLSHNTALTALWCGGNQLTELNVSKNTVLTRLYCGDNQLTVLDLSHNTALTQLGCDNNQLTALDLSHNTALTALWCGGNQLTELVLSQNTALTKLYCFGNQINGGEMARLVKNLPDLTGTNAGEFVVMQEPLPEGNRCLKTDVAIAKGKNWKVQKYNTDDGSLVDYEGEEPIPYAVTLTKEGEGTLTATGADNLNAVEYGTELTIVATPAEGYELTALTANGTDILATKKIVVKEATEVKATFAKITFAVTLTKEAGEGTLKANGADNLNAVAYGTELTIEATPAEGYELKALTANGTDILATKKFVVKEATEVKATFAKKTFTVTLTKEGEGTLNATGADDLNAVPFDTELTIEATPVEGYELTALTANGTDILATKKVVVKEATEVKATFAKKTFAVKLTKEGEGTLNATGADNLNAVAYGTVLTIEATPAAGYELTALTANGADILATKKVVVKGATEIKATFTKKTAADSVEAGSVRLYPNPASTYVNVKAAKADALVRLYDANGTLLYEARTDDHGILQIELSAYAEGTYLLLMDGNAQSLLIQR